MIIKFSKTEKIKTTEGTIWDYPISEEIGIALQKLQSRGPEKGRYLNKVCHEIYFIINGTATFVVGNERHEAGQNDVIVVPENTPHHIEVETEELNYITITRPDWYEGQYELVEVE